MNTTTRYLLSSAAALLLGSSALTAADFIWISTSNAGWGTGTNWQGGSSPSASPSDTTKSIGTPTGFGDVLITGSSTNYLLNFNVDLSTNWQWRPSNSTTPGLTITGTLTKAGSAALTFTNNAAASATDTGRLTLDINQLDAQAGILNLGRTRSDSTQHPVNSLTVGATTLATNATVNVNSPDASFGVVTLSGGTLNIFQALDQSASTTLATGGITVAGLSGSAGTVQTRNGVGSAARAAQGTLTLSAASGSYTYGGTLADGSEGSTLAVVKSGASTQILTGTNTYTGGTVVETGLLATDDTGNFGTGDVHVFAATLTLGNATSIADTATLFFSDTSTINLSFTGTALMIGALTNETSGASAADGLYTAAQLNAFFGGNIFNGDGLLGVGAAIVPEPATVTALLGLIAAALFLARRRQRSAS